MPEQSATPSTRTSGRIKKILKAAAWTFGCIIALTIISVAAISIYLTPARLTAIVNREASKYLLADVKATNVDYTLWSTFPDLYVSADSLTINSRSLRNLPEKIRKDLPLNCDSLVSTGGIMGSINVLQAIRGIYNIKNLNISSPKLNLVSYDRQTSNFNIFPETHICGDIPQISIDSARITSPARISYFDASSMISAKLDINRMLLVKNNTEDSYRLSLSGTADGSLNDFHSPEKLPLRADGVFGVNLIPLSFSLSKFALCIAGIDTYTDAEITAGETITVQSFSSVLKLQDATGLEKIITPILPQQLKDIEGYVPVYANIRLTRPYLINQSHGHSSPSSEIPAFSSAVEIKDATISCHASDNSELKLDRINLYASINIDPAHSESNRIDINSCTLVSDGSKISLEGYASEILSGKPGIYASVGCNADLKKLSKMFFPNSPLKIEGTINGDSEITCILPSFSEKKVENLDFKGGFKSARLKITDTAKQMTAYLSGLHIGLIAEFPSLSADSLTDGKINLVSSASKSLVTNIQDSLAITLYNPSVKIDMGAKGTSAAPVAAGNLAIRSDSMTTNSPGLHLESSDIALNIDASLRHSPWTTSSAWTAQPASHEDSIICSRTKHSPLYLTVQAPPVMQTVMSLADISGMISAKKTTILSDSYPAPVIFSSLDMTTDLDTMSIENLHVVTRSSAADISGRVKGLRNFLTSSTPALLAIDIDADFSNININELAGTYYAGTPEGDVLSSDPDEVSETPYTAADSICIVIPRNIIADVRLRTDCAEYQKWRFSPLSTQITMRNGNAKIGNLKIGSDFCSAHVDWIYSTEDLSDIFMHLDAGVDNFDFDKFFSAFPSLLTSQPELDNLSGQLSASAGGGFLMFPDMFLNTPSLEGEMTVEFDSLRYERDKKTSRITHLMLIKGDAPLEADNFKIHGSFHDNFLQIDPFTVNCGGYEVMAGGVNNLNGEMYYHLGLIRSPFHFPFGVNIVGDFHHPSIRFGGNGINDGRERDISADLRESADVNIMRELHDGWLLFIENAAKYDIMNNHDYISDVP